MCIRDRFMNQWYFGEGYPVFAINWHQQDNELVIDVKQKGSSSKAPIFKTTLEFKVLFKDGTDTLIRASNDKLANELIFHFEKEIKVIRFNPNSNLLCSYSCLLYTSPSPRDQA
eukprot:TRINITY_DN28363_c0_g1_i1.p1 TRINITY_DN28363_c0_g1~~TRINITY_DN28363_c0_g1_i1.p1  ORF type:complete len:131 (-),score=3.38 TRINITY_DN28363_c0_g1_i1:26-367(-)